MSGRDWDVAVIGGGPAGLSGALWLGRYRRRVLVLDDARPRNEAAWAVHGYPGLEDPHPAALRVGMREQAAAAGAGFEERMATRIIGEKDAFDVETREGWRMRARRLLLAYGRQDRIPDLPGLHELYGQSVFHCPDCDGPSVTGARVGVLGHDRDAATIALYLLTWAQRVVLLTNGLEPDLSGEAHEVLRQHGVAMVTTPIEAVDGSSGRLRRVRLTQGSLDLDALFFHWGSDPTSTLGPATGCECDDAGHILVDPKTLQTSVEGVYAAGDIVGRPHLTISAAAEGVRAALAIHRSLLPPEFHI